MNPVLPRGAFLAIFQALRVRFGYEESCKLGHGRLLTERCLVSFGRSALCDGNGADLGAVPLILSQLAAPGLCAAWLAQYETGASIIHFGYEAEEDKIVHKIYLEYVRDARNALSMQGGPREPVLVHRALKWRAGTSDVRETHYRLMPSQGLSIDERLARHADGATPRPSTRMARDVLRQALTRVPADDMILLDVADVDSARRSFDLQLYNAELRLADIHANVTQLGRELAIPAAPLEAFLGCRAGIVLGHIAGGEDAAGHPFATLYYGVQGQ